MPRRRATRIRCIVCRRSGRRGRETWVYARDHLTTPSSPSLLPPPPTHPHTQKKKDLLSSGSVDRDSYFAALEEDHRRLMSSAQELHKRLVIFTALSDQHKAKAAARGRTVDALRAEQRAAAAQADAREERLAHLEAENRRLAEQVTQEVEAERRRADSLEREVRELRLLAAAPAAAATAAAVTAAQARADAPLPIVAAAGGGAASSASSCGGGVGAGGSEPALFPSALERGTRGMRARLREVETQLAAETARARRLSALVGEAATSVERRGRGQQQQHPTHAYQRATSASRRGGMPVHRARSHSASRGGGGSGERHLNSTADGGASRSLDSRGGAVVVAGAGAVEGKMYIPRTGDLEAWVGEDGGGAAQRYDRPIRSQRETDYWVPPEIFRYCGEFASRVCRGVTEEQFYPFMIRCNVIWHKEQAQALDALRTQHRAEMRRVKGEARKAAKRMTQIEASIDLASLKAEVARVSRFKYHSHEHYVDVPTYKKFLLHALTAAQTLVGRAAAAEGEAHSLRLTHDSTAQRDHVCGRAAAVLAEVVEDLDARTDDFKSVIDKNYPALAPVVGDWCVDILSPLKVLCSDLVSRI